MFTIIEGLDGCGKGTIANALAAVAAEIACILKRECAPAGLVLHLDREPGRFDIRRGEHDIVMREPIAV